MKKIQRTLPKEDSTPAVTLYMAIELSHTEWKLAFSTGEKIRIVTMDARDLDQLHKAIDGTKERFGALGAVQILSCYEAGRDGFWLHRYLLNRGIENLVVDSSSIEVNRRKRRAKTDRIDAGKLVGMLMRYHGGERRLWAVVHVPSTADEDARHLHRELEVLNKERTMHRSRIKGLLIQHGIAATNPSSRTFLLELESFRTWDGQPVPRDLTARVIREHGRLRMVEEQIYALRKERESRLQSAESLQMRKIAQLMTLHGIGINSSWKFVMEFFGWRNFKNRREVGALSGLTPTPYDSGGREREQGISKAGNTRIRTLAVEMAWMWLRFQPQSNVSRWYRERFASGGSRMRRIGIVAMARRLLIDLWRYLEYGVIPEGAHLRTVAQ
jgi:transposase